MSLLQRSERFPRLALAAGLLGGLLLGSGRAEAQYVGMPYYYYGGFNGVPNYYYGGLGINWPLVQFPTVTFPAYMGIANNYYNYWNINPYAYWDRWAAADSYWMSKYALNSSRYNLAAASMATSSMANSLLARDTFEEMAWRNAASGAGITGRYDVHHGLPGGAIDDPREADRSRLLALTSRDGDVLWPISAPAQGDLLAKRREANQAIKDVVKPYRTKGTAPVDDVVKASQALAGYARPAAEQLRNDHPGGVGRFLDFVAGLDSGLRALTPKPPAVGSPPEEADKPAKDANAP